jgi:predicted ABC-type ATPase
MKELIIIAGANGSGKTTFSKQILAETGFEFLNADEIAKNYKQGKSFLSDLTSFWAKEQVLCWKALCQETTL